MADFLITLRKVKKQGKTKTLTEEPGGTQFLAVPHDQDPDGEHICTKTDWLQGLTEQNQDCESLLFVIFGDQRDSANALATQRMLSKNLRALGFRGTVIGFDWLAPVGPLATWEDRDYARDAAKRFRDDCISTFCSQVIRSTNIPVHILAHGSGAYLLREAMTLADEKQGLKNQTWRVNQIALMGADISSRSLRGDSPRSSALLRHCYALTNYQNPYDDYLSQSNSRVQSLSERAGRVGLPRHDGNPKALNVNCGEQFSVLNHESPADNPLREANFAHKWYFSNSVLLQDFVHCMDGKIDRHYIPTRQRLHNELSLFNPESIFVLEE